MKSTLLKKKEAGETAWLAGLRLLLASEGTLLQVPDTLVAGWLDVPAAAIRTSPAGRLLIVRNVSSDFIAAFTAPQTACNFPLCVMRQNSTVLVSDSLAVTGAWHKSLVSGRMVFLQRYVVQPGTNSNLVRVVWKPSGVRIIRLTNKTPYHGRRMSAINSLIAKSTSPAEERYLTRPENASMSSVSADPALATQISICIELLKQTLNQPRHLSEVTLEFTQDATLRWFFLRVVSYEVARVIRHTLRPGRLFKRSATAGLKGKMSIKRLSQAILSIKQVMGLEITSGDRKRVSNHTDFSRAVSTAPAKGKRTNTHFDSSSHLPGAKVSTDMPPIFQFPTPRDDEDLNISTGPERIREIHEHIKRQNNSLFMRIHFQEELPQDRMVKEIVKHSVDSIVRQFDQLRLQRSRERLKLLMRNAEEES